MDALKVLFLTEGAQTAESVARWLAGLVAAARVSVDLAIYDCHLEGEAAEIFVGALQDRARAGVAIRVVYNAPGALPGQGVVADPGHPAETAAFLVSSGLPVRPVGDSEGTRLMHHKYMLVDAGTPGALVWTGSANLTTAAFTRQENNLLAIASPPLVARYAGDFEQLWSTGDLARSGGGPPGLDVVSYAGAPAGIEVRFAPGSGAGIDHEVADRIGAARREVTVASVVLSSGRILGALRDLAPRGIPLSGIVDISQMETIVAAWRRIPPSQWKADAFEAVVRYGRLHGKRSARSWPVGPHDYMHNKVIVVDETVITGSYNYSVSAQSNAENILFIESPALASAYRAYVADLTRIYPQA